VLVVHRFRFLPSKKTTGHTLFVQEEDFGGVLGSLGSDNWLGHTLGFAGNLKKNFIKFNDDFATSFEK